MPGPHAAHVPREGESHPSKLVDVAEHRGQRILILRHGKPAATIVAVNVAEQSTRHRVMTPAQAEVFLNEIAALAPRPRRVDVRDVSALARVRLHSVREAEKRAGTSIESARRSL